MASTIDSYNKQVKRVSPYFAQDLVPAGTILDGNKVTIGTSGLYYGGVATGTPSYPFVTVELQTSSGGLPTGTVLGSGTITAPSPSVILKRVEVVGLSGISLSASTVYHLVMKDNNGNILYGQSFTTTTAGELVNVRLYISNDVGFKWVFSSGNIYAGGSRLVYSGTWSTTTGDYLFSVTLQDDTNIQFAEYSGLVDSYVVKKQVDDFYGLALTSANVELPDILTRMVSTGISYEGWTNSTIDKTKPYIGGTSRRVTATTGTASDEYVFEKIEGSINRLDISKFYNITNQVDSTNIIDSDDEDYIEVDVYTDDVDNLDLTACTIAFYSDDGQTNFSISFDNSLVDLVSGQWTTLLFRKGDFTLDDPLTLGLANNVEYWSECSYKVVREVTSVSGTESVWFSGIRHKGKIAKFTQRGLPIQLGTYVSEDDGLTWYNTNEFDGRTVNTDAQVESAGVECSPYLDLVNKSTLPNTQQWEYGTDTANPFTPATILENVLEQFEGVSGVNTPSFEPLHVKYAYIDNTKQLEEYNELLAKAGLLNVSTDSQGQVNILNANEYFVTTQNSGYLDPKLYKSFKKVSANKNRFYNRVVLKGGVRSKVVTSAPFSANLGTTIYLSTNESRLAPANSTVTFTFKASELIAEPINNETVSLFSWNFGVDESTTTYSNTNISLVRVRILGGDVLVTFRNTNASARYLRTIRILSQAVVVNEEIYIEESNQDSIDQFGVSTLEIESPFIQSYGFRYLALLILEKYSVPTETYELEMSYQPDLAIGQKYLVRNLQNKTVLCTIESVDTIYNRSGLISRLTLREDYLGVEGSFDTTRPYFSEASDGLMQVCYDGSNPVNQGFNAQSIPNNTWTQINFAPDVATYSPGLSLHYSILNGFTGWTDIPSGGSLPALVGITVPVGQYRVSYKVVYSANSTGTRQIRVQLYDGGSLTGTSHTSSLVTASGITTVEGEYTTGLAGLSGNLRLETRQTSGGALTLIPKECYLRVVRIA